MQDSTLVWNRSTEQGAGIALASDRDDLSVHDMNVSTTCITCSRTRVSSHNHFDVRPVTGRLGERRIAGDDRRLERLRQRDIHGVVRRNVVSQLPRASQEIEVGMAVEIEIGEICNRLGRPVT